MALVAHLLASTSGPSSVVQLENARYRVFPDGRWEYRFPIQLVPGVLRLAAGRLCFTSSRGPVFDLDLGALRDGSGADLDLGRRGRGFRITVGGERLQVHPASVTNAVDRLEGQGFVRRAAHPTDRRTTLVELTEAGRAVAAKATDELNASVFAHPGLSPDAVDQLVAVLTRMRADAGDF